MLLDDGIGDECQSKRRLDDPVQIDDACPGGCAPATHMEDAVRCKPMPRASRR